MNKAGKINGYDSLEKEIYRLRLKAAETGKKLEDNMSSFRENATTLFARSLFSRKKADTGKNKSGQEGFFKSERLNTMINRIADRISDRTAESIDSLVDRIFSKHRHHSGE